MKVTSETIARILQPYNICIAHKLVTTLQQLLINVKDKTNRATDRQGAVYNIKCCNCQATYIGETSRNLNIRLTEHKWATRNGDNDNHIAEHHFKNKLQNWLGLCWMHYLQYRLLSTNHSGSWFTNLEQTPLNRCQQLPAPYKWPVDNHNKTDKQ